jgi:hypothetical protein
MCLKCCSNDSALLTVVLTNISTRVGRVSKQHTTTAAATEQPHVLAGLHSHELKERKLHNQIARLLTHAQQQLSKPTQAPQHIP